MKKIHILSIFLLAFSVFNFNIQNAFAAPPTVVTLSPADNATNVQLTDNLTITFSAAVDATTGNIVIYRASDDSVLETIDVTSGKVTGTGTTTITINPGSNFNKNTAYYVQIANTAFENVGNEAYAGINNTTSWNFTTVNSGSSGVQSVPLCTLSANKSQVAKGEPVELSVLATGQNLDNYYFRLENTGQDLGPGNNKVTVTPMSDTVYKVFVINQFGANACEQKISVVEKAPETVVVIEPTQTTLTPEMASPAPQSNETTSVTISEKTMPKGVVLGINRTLRRQKGNLPEARSLQQILNFLNNSELVADGSFGPRTEAVVRAWQKANGLRADGVVGPMTRKVLEEKLLEKINSDASNVPQIELVTFNY